MSIPWYVAKLLARALPRTCSNRFMYDYKMLSVNNLYRYLLIHVQTYISSFDLLMAMSNISTKPQKMINLFNVPENS